MSMIATSLWQPWASAMADAAKRNETRGWATRYRGDLVICSAKRRPRRGELPPELYDFAMSVPYGFALCVVEVYDCVPTEYFDPTRRANFIRLSEAERSLGDYTPGRWAWLTRNCRKLRNPVPVVGKQGFFYLPPDVEARVKLELAP